MAKFSLLVLVTLLVLATCQGAPKPLPGHDMIYCQSWRFGVETNNIIGWDTIPKECNPTYMLHYLLGPQYSEDSKAVVDSALFYAQRLVLPRDGRNVWVVDVDETALSNLPYYVDHGFGTKQSDNPALVAWISSAKAPALPETLRLYKTLVSLGIKIVFITGRRTSQVAATATNLKNVGYHTWEKLIARNDSDPGTFLEFKSMHRTLLVKQGYRIVGNIGDQWSDLLGPYEGNRVFKLPNPMYYTI